MCKSVHLKADVKGNDGICTLYGRVFHNSWTPGSLTCNNVVANWREYEPEKKEEEKKCEGKDKQTCNDADGCVYMKNKKLEKYQWCIEARSNCGNDELAGKIPKGKKDKMKKDKNDVKIKTDCACMDEGTADPKYEAWVFAKKKCTCYYDIKEKKGALFSKDEDGAVGGLIDRL